MIRIYSNAAGTKRLIVNNSAATFKDQNVLSVHSASEFSDLIAKHHLVELPLSHRCFLLKLEANKQEVAVRVTLFELEKNLPGVWFRAEVARMTGDRRTLPCYFTFVPSRKRRGVYHFEPVVNMIHATGSDLSLFAQTYSDYEPIKESALRVGDYAELGITGQPRKKRA